MSVRRQGGRHARGGITAVAVEGFKSIADRQHIDIRPLTLLAGVNSSGKSSMMQPLLLLKQTLQSVYDPGALLLDGPNVRFTKAEQVLSRIGRRRPRFSIQLTLDNPYMVEATYRRGSGATAFIVESTTVTDDWGSVTVKAGMTPAQISAALGERRDATNDEAGLRLSPFFYSFLVAESRAPDAVAWQLYAAGPIVTATDHMHDIVHVPAWRGDPKRSYPVTAVDDRRFPGTFDRYVASMIAEWRRHDKRRHHQAELDLAELGLTTEVSVRAVDETQLELLVGRLAAPRGSADLVNIADVGFGVSQCLPVVVAMLAAAPDQLVYIEEPEIHLHPRAQVALAQLAVRAAKRGVRLVLETHSSLLLRGIQTAVARKEIPADQVALHWFERSEAGATQVRTAELADDGSFGDWPVDFDEVALAAERDYLDAS